MCGSRRLSQKPSRPPKSHAPSAKRLITSELSRRACATTASRDAPVSFKGGSASSALLKRMNRTTIMRGCCDTRHVQQQQQQQQHKAKKTSYRCTSSVYVWILRCSWPWLWDRRSATHATKGSRSSGRRPCRSRQVISNSGCCICRCGCTSVSLQRKEATVMSWTTKRLNKGLAGSENRHALGIHRLLRREGVAAAGQQTPPNKTRWTRALRLARL